MAAASYLLLQDGFHLILQDGSGDLLLEAEAFVFSSAAGQGSVAGGVRVQGYVAGAIASQKSGSVAGAAAVQGGL